MNAVAPHIKTFVSDLEEHVRFYTRVFGVRPTTLDQHSATWLLDDPPLRFEVGTASGQAPQFLGTGPV